VKERGHSLDLSLSVSLNGGKERERVERATGGGFFDESTNADYDDAASQEDKRVTEERERERGEKRKIRRAREFNILRLLSKIFYEEDIFTRICFFQDKYNLCQIKRESASRGRTQ